MTDTPTPNSMPNPPDALARMLATHVEEAAPVTLEEIRRRTQHRRGRPTRLLSIVAAGAAAALLFGVVVARTDGTNTDVADEDPTGMGRDVGSGGNQVEIPSSVEGVRVLAAWPAEDPSLRFTAVEAGGPTGVRLRGEVTNTGTTVASARLSGSVPDGTRDRLDRMFAERPCTDDCAFGLDITADPAATQPFELVLNQTPEAAAPHRTLQVLEFRSAGQAVDADPVGVVLVVATGGADPRDPVAHSRPLASSSVAGLDIGGGARNDDLDAEVTSVEPSRHTPGDERVVSAAELTIAVRSMADAEIRLNDPTESEPGEALELTTTTRVPGAETAAMLVGGWCEMGVAPDGTTVASCRFPDTGSDLPAGDTLDVRVRLDLRADGPALESGIHRVALPLGYRASSDNTDGILWLPITLVVDADVAPPTLPTPTRSLITAPAKLASSVEGVTALASAPESDKVVLRPVEIIEAAGGAAARFELTTPDDGVWSLRTDCFDDTGGPCPGWPVDGSDAPPIPVDDGRAEVPLPPRASAPTAYQLLVRAVPNDSGSPFQPSGTVVLNVGTGDTDPNPVRHTTEAVPGIRVGAIAGSGGGPASVDITNLRAGAGTTLLTGIVQLANIGDSTVWAGPPIVASGGAGPDLRPLVIMEEGCGLEPADPPLAGLTCPAYELLPRPLASQASTTRGFNLAWPAGGEPDAGVYQFVSRFDVSAADPNSAAGRARWSTVPLLLTVVIE